MNVTLTRHRMRIANSGANRKVNSTLWKPMDPKSKANAAAWFLVAVVVNVSVIALLIGYFG